jgi:hypothetical protein
MSKVKEREVTNLLVAIPNDIYEGLKLLAEKEHRSLKNYGEKILIEHFEASKELIKKKTVKPVKEQLKKSPKK